MKLELERRTLGLRSPLPASYGVLHERELLIVKITDSDGSFGYGEAAPLPDYDGPDIDQVLRALDAYREVLEHAEGLNGVQTVDACRRVADMPVAYAAIDLALWDKAGRYSEKPVAQLLVEEPANSVPVNATLTSLDRAGIAEQATMAVREGFGCLKVKVGVGDDAGRVAAVRAAAGPQAVIRLDANGAWTPDQAVRAIASLSPAGLELFEEPTHGLQAVREVRERVAVRVAIDETAAEPGALGAGVADAVCLKISRCGGIAGLIAAAALVRASGAEVYLGSTIDGPLGIAAALHAAAALATRGPMPDCGLATLGMFADVHDPLPPRHGVIELPTGPGLGVEPL